MPRDPHASRDNPPVTAATSPVADPTPVDADHTLADHTLVDTHCHLDMPPLDSRPVEILAAARRAGVGVVITVGIDPPSSEKAVALAARHAGVFATVGIHPHNVAAVTDDDYIKLRALVAGGNGSRVVAYGEIGLDFVKLRAPADLQVVHFRRQLRLARELELPIIIHDREAHDLTLAILAEEGPFPAGGVMHCFSGDMRLAEQVIELGLLISIPGIVTFNSAAALREVARQLPLSSLLLETDAPFLAPVPRRGRTNEPAFLPFTANKVAELRQETLAAVARATTANAIRLFRLEERGERLDGN